MKKNSYVFVPFIVYDPSIELLTKLCGLRHIQLMSKSEQHQRDVLFVPSNNDLVYRMFDDFNCHGYDDADDIDLATYVSQSPSARLDAFDINHDKVIDVDDATIINGLVNSRKRFYYSCNSFMENMVDEEYVRFELVDVCRKTFSTPKYKTGALIKNPSVNIIKKIDKIFCHNYIKRNSLEQCLIRLFKYF